MAEDSSNQIPGNRETWRRRVAALAADYAKDSSSENEIKNWEPPSPRDLNGLLPGYRITELIGKGGMGAVYLGVQESLERNVAIKLLPPALSADLEFECRFRREAKAMANLNHPNIVQIYDYGQLGEAFHFLIMEYVAGKDLGVKIREERPTSTQSLKWLEQVCAALEYAHLRGFVHRDIKPANILLTQEGAAKLGDFGLAKLLSDKTEDGSTSMDITLTGVSMGTPAYMAPEQIDGMRKTDQRTDIYSLGVVAYEILTGEIPRGNFPRPSTKVENISKRFDAITLKAMAVDPDDRYQSASEMAKDICQERARTEKTVRKRKTKIPIAIILSSVALLILAGWWLDQQKEDPANLVSYGSYRLPGMGRIDVSSTSNSAPLEQVYLGESGWLGLNANGNLTAGGQFKNWNNETGVVSIRHGAGSKCLLLKNSGQLLIADTSGPPGSVPELSNDGMIKDAMIASSHGLALFENGSIETWGRNYKDLDSPWPSPPQFRNPISQIAIGEFFSAALDAEGEVTVWGSSGAHSLPIEVERPVLEMGSGLPLILSIRDAANQLILINVGRVGKPYGIMENLGDCDEISDSAGGLFFRRPDGRWFARPDGGGAAYFEPVEVSGLFGLTSKDFSGMFNRQTGPTFIKLIHREN